MVASRAEGVEMLLVEALRLTRKPASFKPARPEIGTPHQQVHASLQSLLGDLVPPPYNADWVAMKLLEGDDEITDLARGWLSESVWRAVEGLLRAHEDAWLDIASGRYEWIGRMVRAAVKQPRLGQVSLTDRLDRYAVHPFWGMLVLFVVFALVFGATVKLGTPIQAWLDAGVVAPLREWLRATLSPTGPRVSSLIADGVVGGAGTVLTFLPILTVFFAAMALLEDTGYLARAAYVMDRFMHFLGLHGKSFLPLFLGFGCNVPAVMGARVIEARSGRLLTILLAPLVPCSARLAVLAFLAPAFFEDRAVAVIVALVAVNLVVLAVVGVALNHTVFRGQHMAFIMELPLYHTPSTRTVVQFVWHNTWAFLRKAGSLILLMSVVVWALASLPGQSLENSYLARLGRVLAPLGNLLGMDWRMLVALLSSFVAKENAIATLGILYGTEGAGVGLAETLAARVPPATGLAFLTATMLFIPCAATVAVMRQETGSWRWTLFDVALLLIVALAAAALVYQSCRLFGLGVAHA
jgi:ferrous iron transport protein B